MKKSLIPGLEQGTHRKSPGHGLVPESEQTLKEGGRHVGTQKPPCRDSQTQGDAALKPMEFDRNL